jgi:hypothetical protein
MIAHIYPSVLQAVSGRGYAGCLDGCFQGYRGGAMQDLGYELPRILILGTSVNKSKKKGRSPVRGLSSRRDVLARTDFYRPVSCASYPQ